MPKKLFHELVMEKREKITAAALAEFSQYGFTDSSTNRIVKEAEISKGSLFKYFETKEDLYFYILDGAVKDLLDGLKAGISRLSEDLFERVVQYSRMEFEWHIRNPQKYRLIKRAFEDDGSLIYRKTLERYYSAGDSYYYSLFEGINTKILNWSQDKILDVLKWFLKGFNEEFLKDLGFNEDMDNMKKAYLKRLKDYTRILKHGFYKT